MDVILLICELCTRYIYIYHYADDAHLCFLF